MKITFLQVLFITVIAGIWAVGYNLAELIPHPFDYLAMLGLGWYSCLASDDWFTYLKSKRNGK